MDRILVYPSQVPLDTMFLEPGKNAMLGLGGALAAVLGTSTLVDGLPCAATTPASMGVVVGPGAIYSLQNVDSTAYSSLPADTAHQTVKQGFLTDAVTLATPAPATAGQSVIYLVQAAFAEADVDPVVLPYYNASNPDQAYAGPNNSGVTQNTLRKAACLVSAKAGVAAVSPAAPAPDAGYVGLYTVTVANGQASVTAANVAPAPGAPFISEKLTAKISKPTADAYYGPNHGQCYLSLAGGSLVLAPENGNKLMINGVMRTIPNAGVPLASTGLATGTTYWIYAFLNTAGAMASEADTTPPAVDAATGMKVKSGDPSRTYVGVARTTASGAWADTEQQRFVASHFNRRVKRGWNGVTNAVINSGTDVELDASKRAEFVTHGDAGVYAEAHTYTSNTNSGATNWITLGVLTGTPTVVEIAPAVTFAAGATVAHPSAAVQGNFAAGYNAVTMKGRVSGGTATYVCNTFVTVYG